MKFAAEAKSHRERELIIRVPLTVWPQVWVLLNKSQADHGGYLTVSLSLPRKPRTTGEKSQNNHAHGHAQQIAEETGHDVGEVLHYAKMRAIIAAYARRHHYSAAYTEYAMTHRFCEVSGFPAAFPHHIRSRGSGGPDEAWNLLSLSRALHAEIHNIGPRRFAERHPQVAGKIHAALERSVL